MKKILLSFSLVIFLMLFIHSKSLAYSDDQKNLFKQMIIDTFNVTLNDHYLSQIMTQWEGSNGQYLYAGNDGVNYLTFILSSSDSRIGSNFKLQVNSGDPYINVYIPAQGSTYWGNSSATFQLSNGYLFGLFDESMIPVDFDNPVYNPSIPVPKIELVYPDQLADGQNYNVPLILKEYSTGYNLEQEFYIEYKIRMRVPSTVYIVNNGNGNYSDSIGDYISSEWTTVQSLQDRFETLAFSNSNLDYTSYNLDSHNGITDSGLGIYNLWKDFRTENSAAEIGVYMYSGNGLSVSPNYLNARKTLYQTYGNALPLLGNRLELMIRYFTIVDGQVQVGDWRYWYSDLPNFYDVQSSLRYDPTSVVNSGSVDLTPDQADSVEDNQGISTDTGSNVTVTVNNNNLPNTYNYPTVATYNTDNILLTALDTANDLPKTFDGFGSFLASAFQFIPAGIWNIIACGFCFCIVIMIVKVL